MNFHGATNIAVRNRAWVAEHGYKLIEGRVCEDACALYRHRKPTDDPEAGRFGQLVAWVAFERDAPSGHRGHTGTCTSTTCDTQRLPLPSRRVLTRRVIQVRMGHADIGTTMNLYGHLFEGQDALCMQCPTPHP